MNDTREALRRGIGDFIPQPDAYRRVLEKNDRRMRNRRRGALAVVALIVLVGALTVVKEFRSVPPILDNDSRPSDLPSNGAVAFSAVLDQEADVGAVLAKGQDLYLTTPGGEPRRIAGFVGDGLDQRCPAFSPDGTKLAYVEVGERMKSSAVLLLDVGADGVPSGSPNEILADVTGCPQWSPSGDRLAITDDGEVQIIGLNGESSTVSTGRLIDPPLAWSPDGSTLAILDSGVLQIVPADGGDPQTVWTAVSKQEAYAIAWSPEGAQLAVSGVNDLEEPSACCDGDTPFLEIVDVRAGSRTPVQVEGEPRGDTAEAIEWLSADRIAVSFFRGTTDLVDPTGAVPARSAGLSFSDASIGVVASPDLEWLLYIAWEGDGAYAVVAEPVDGGPPVFYSPWSFGLYFNLEDLAWQPIPR